jgi:Oxidoreductase family, C-terminal alpha/beta domain
MRIFRISFRRYGLISYRLKRELHFDPHTGQFTGDAEANAMLRDEYRAPFSVPEKV